MHLNVKYYVKSHFSKCLTFKSASWRFKVLTTKNHYNKVVLNSGALALAINIHVCCSLLACAWRWIQALTMYNVIVLASKVLAIMNILK